MAVTTPATRRRRARLLEANPFSNSIRHSDPSDAPSPNILREISLLSSPTLSTLDWYIDNWTDDSDALCLQAQALHTMTDAQRWHQLTKGRCVIGEHGCWIQRTEATDKHPFGNPSKYPGYHYNRRGLKTYMQLTTIVLAVQGFEDILFLKPPKGSTLKVSEASHLCGHPRCTRPSHVVFESHSDNMGRQLCFGSYRNARGELFDPCTHGPEETQCFGHSLCPSTCAGRQQLERKFQTCLSTYRRIVARQTAKRRLAKASK